MLTKKKRKEKERRGGEARRSAAEVKSDVQIHAELLFGSAMVISFLFRGRGGFHSCVRIKKTKGIRTKMKLEVLGVCAADSNEGVGPVSCCK